MNDVNDSAVVEWGTDREDVDYVCGILDEIQGLANPAMDDYATDYASFVASIRGCATGLGLLIPVNADAPAVLRDYLIASRDAEGEKSEKIIGAAYGKSADEQKAARIAAMPYSGRRGWLDSAATAVSRGLEKLDELKAWQASQVKK